MEDLNTLIQLFGVSTANIASIAVMAYLVVELVKKKMPSIFTQVWVAQVISLLACFGMAYKTYGLAWEQLIAAGLISWFGADALNAARTNK